MNRLFAISDIHGCFRPFYELVTNTIHLQKSDKLVLLGDYIDRGDRSKEVIDFILDLITKGFSIIPLTGNHEVMLLNSYNNPDDLPLWLLNSGMSTLNSFGLGDITELETRYLDFFKSLGFYFETGKLIFVHAGLNDFTNDPFSDRHIMIWESRLNYNNPALSGKTIIHGHRPRTITDVRRLISQGSHVIPIDTGCVYGWENGYGHLSALELNSMTLHSVAYLPDNNS